MSSGETSGESSSCSGRENGAALSELDRPHKKARFPWQIKGKHHLKTQIGQQTENPAAIPEVLKPTTPSPEPVIPRERIVPCKPLDNSCASFGKEVKPIARQGSKRLIWHGSGRPVVSSTSDSIPPLPLETVISLAESMIMRSEIGSTRSTAQIQVNSILEQQESVPRVRAASPRLSKALVSARNARRLRREEEKCISRWQAVQTVKGCFDNTINRVLESWMSAPASVEERFLALDFARIMNDLPQNDDNVENEGILMAINAHGLQNVPTVGGIPVIAPTEQLANTLASEIPICEDSDSSLCSEDFEIPADRGSYSPWPSYKQTNEEQDSDTAPSTITPWRQIPDESNENQSGSYQYLENNQAGEDYEYEFMNAAVIQAIKSKGLMAAGTDFG